MSGLVVEDMQIGIPLHSKVVAVYLPSLSFSLNPNIVLPQEDDDWNYKQYYGGSPVVTDMRDEALLKLDMGEALNKPPNKFNP